MTEKLNPALPKRGNLILFGAGALATAFLSIFVLIHQQTSPISIGSASAPNPYWVIITAIWQTGILGGGAYFYLMIFVPYISQFDTMHEVSAEEKKRMQTSLGGLFKKAKHWPDHPVRFMLSYLSKGIAFLVLAGVLIAIVFSVGWKAPTSWPNLRYDLLFARSTKDPNSAHLMSYLPVPAIGLWVAWKFRTGDGLPNSYLGLIVAAFGVAIHEGEWIVGYYFFYGKYLTYATTYNVLGDVFFVVMLYIFFYIYRNYPFQQISLKDLRWVAVMLAFYLLAWAFAGYHITTANNFLITQTQFNTTQWWPDAATNAWEVGSWLLTYILMAVSIAFVKPQGIITLRQQSGSVTAPPLTHVLKTPLSHSILTLPMSCAKLAKYIRYQVQSNNSVTTWVWVCQRSVTLQNERSRSWMRSLRKAIIRKPLNI